MAAGVDWRRSKIGVAAGVDWLWITAGVGGGGGIGGGIAHFAQHGGTAGAEEAKEKKRAEDEEYEVENGGVVPGDGCIHDGELVVDGDEMQRGEDGFYDESGTGHGEVEGDGEEGGDFESVVLAVDVEDGEDEEVREEEANNSAEADATVPKDGGEGDVADRADEGEDGDQGADERAPDASEHGVAGEEEGLPEAGGDEGGEDAGDEQAECDVGDEGVPIHPVVVAGGSDAAAGGDFLPERAFVKAHVHGGVALHATGEAEVGMGAGDFDEARAEGGAEKDDQHGDHDGPADEFGRHELPSEEDAEENAELDDEVGGGELECHGGDEVGPFTKESTGERSRCVGAGRGGRAESGGLEDGAWGGVWEETGELGFGDDGFDDGGDKEAERECPEYLPGHDAGHAEGFDGVGEHGDSLGL